MQNRLRSKMLWAAVASFIILALMRTGVVDTEGAGVLGELSEKALSIAVLAGVLNNPTDSTKF